MLLVTCSGISNTGRLTTLAARTLQMRHPGRFEWVQASRLGTGSGDLDWTQEQILVMDGCNDCCGMKKLDAAGKPPYMHMICTALGIKKNGMAEVTCQEIEIICHGVTGAGVLFGD
jgi:uncharacterized metal-binding protein